MTDVLQLDAPEWNKLNMAIARSLSESYEHGVSPADHGKNDSLSNVQNTNPVPAVIHQVNDQALDLTSDDELKVEEDEESSDSSDVIDPSYIPAVLRERLCVEKMTVNLDVDPKSLSDCGSCPNPSNRIHIGVKLPTCACFPKTLCIKTFFDKSDIEEDDDSGIPTMYIKCPACYKTLDINGPEDLYVVYGCRQEEETLEQKAKRIFRAVEEMTIERLDRINETVITNAIDYCRRNTAFCEGLASKTICASELADEIDQVYWDLEGLDKQHEELARQLAAVTRERAEKAAHYNGLLAANKEKLAAFRTTFTAAKDVATGFQAETYVQRQLEWIGAASTAKELPPLPKFDKVPDFSPESDPKLARLDFAHKKRKINQLV